MDKLKPFGIGISGCIDGFSRKIIWLEANSNTSDPQHIGGFYLEAVQKIGGSPIVVRADRGTENGHVGCFQKFLREHDDVLSGDNSFMVGRSTANQRIEAWWGQLRKQCTEFWLTLFHFLAEEGHFCGDLLDKELIRFIFLKFVQNDLDEVVRTWDGHCIRKSKQDHVTCGRPDTMFFLPEVYQTQDFLKRVDQEKIEICREDCKFKSDCPCDPDFFDFCCRTMATNAWEYPDCPEDAMTLFVNLRRHVRNALNI